MGEPAFRMAVTSCLATIYPEVIEISSQSALNMSDYVWMDCVKMGFVSVVDSNVPWLWLLH